MQDCKIKISTN